MDNSPDSNAKERLTYYLQKFRFLLIAIIAIVVIGVVIAIVVDQVNKAAINSNTAMIESLEDAYSAWTQASDASAKADKEKDFLAIFSDGTKKYPQGSYVRQRAHYLYGELLFEKKSYAEAEVEFETAAKTLPDSYLSPVALIDASASAENAGDAAKAKEQLLAIINGNYKTSALFPRALFNLGRLAEVDQKWTEANTYYQKILDTYDSSNWTKLARDRIIFLKAQSKI